MSSGLKSTDIKKVEIVTRPVTKTNEQQKGSILKNNTSPKSLASVSHYNKIMPPIRKSRYTHEEDSFEDERDILSSLMEKK